MACKRLGAEEAEATEEAREDEQCAVEEASGSTRQAAEESKAAKRKPAEEAGQAEWQVAEEAEAAKGKAAEEAKAANMAEAWRAKRQRIAQFTQKRLRAQGPASTRWRRCPRQPRAAGRGGVEALWLVATAACLPCAARNHFRSQTEFERTCA